MPHFSRNTAFAACLSALAGVIAMTTPADASDKKYVQVGMLECDVEGGIGLLLGSKKDMTCVFKKNQGSEENYKGHVLKIGVDIGFTHDSHIMWAVLAPSGDNLEGALAGKFDGVGAEATIVGGVGANALFNVGKSVALQPFSVQGQNGANVAVGLEQIELEYVK